MNKIVLRILWGIMGVVLIAVGVVCLCLPELTMETLALIFGLTLLLAGVVDIVVFAKGRRLMFGSAWFLVDGILTIILAVFLLFNWEFTTLSLPFVFGMWLLFAGVDRFVLSFDLQQFGVRGWGWG